MIDFIHDIKPSNQTKMTGLDLPEEQVLESALDWIERNEDAYDRYLRLARLQCRSARDGKASPNSCKEWLRTGLDVNESFAGYGALTFDPRRCVSVVNAWAPIFARVAMLRDKSLDFRLAESRYDGYFAAIEY